MLVFSLTPLPHASPSPTLPSLSPSCRNTTYEPCVISSLEYDPRFYGLYLHDDSLLPSTVSMWDHLDEVAPAYQDSLVMHMLHKPIEVSFDKDPDRSAGTSPLMPSHFVHNLTPSHPHTLTPHHSSCLTNHTSTPPLQLFLSVGGLQPAMSGDERRAMQALRRETPPQVWSQVRRSVTVQLE